MLTTMLDRLGTLLSRQFIVGYFVPVLLFASLNALLLGWQVPAFRAWAPAQFAGLQGLYAFPVLMGLAVIAYLMFSVNVYLRGVLEGRRLLPDFVVNDWAQREGTRHTEILTRYRQARDAFYTVQHEKAQWRQRLIDASDAGHAHPQAGASYNASSAAAMLVTALGARRTNLKLVPVAEVEAAVDALVAALGTIDRGGNNSSAVRLRADYYEMLEIITYAEEAWNSDRNTALNELQARFGTGQPFPTRMGNIAAALDSYAETRYRMNLAIFWNRMQMALQSNKEFYGLLLDAKSQLDFLVMCCWLCIFTTALWLLALPCLHFSVAFYAIVFLLGPLLARGFYLLAVENYVLMADVVKSAVDLFRFQLLKTLHISQPAGIRQERALWTSLSTFGEDGIEISYQHDSA